MEYPIDETRIKAISRITEMSYEDMMLKMLKWCAVNLYNGIKTRRVVEDIVLYDINEKGIKTFSFTQLVYNTIPFKTAFKLKRISIQFNQNNVFTFEKYMENLYFNLKTISNNFELELINPEQ